MPDGLSALLYKLAGAAAGSGIAAWFRRSTRWLLQLVSGIWIGLVSGTWLMDWLGWSPTPDYVLLAHTIMGAVGYSLLALALDPRTTDLARGWLARRVKPDETP